jgi:protein ImuB
MFATLHSHEVSVAALTTTAAAFTPRFQVVGSLVLLDASGVSRLFGDAHELGRALQSAQPATQVALAGTATASMILAMAASPLSVIEPGAEAAALAPLSIDLLAALAEARLGDQDQGVGDPKGSPLQGSPLQGWAHPRHTHQAQLTRRPRVQSPNRQSQSPNRISQSPNQIAQSANRIAQSPNHAIVNNRQSSIANLQCLSTLNRWGIRTLGAFASLPRADVHQRLGDLGVSWQRLAAGKDDVPLVPWMAEPVFEEMLELEWPIDGLEPLSFVLARLFEPLGARLERADRGAVVIRTSLRLTTRAVHLRTIPLPAPMRDPKTLRTLVLLDLESHPPDAAVDRVQVILDPTPGRVLQWTLFERARPEPEQVSTLIARLTALVGEGHVGSPALEDTWKPGAFRMTPFAPDPLAVIGEPAPASARCAFRRFRLPVPVRVRVEDGRPVRVITDRHGVTGGAIVEAAGPWRTSGDWWAAEPDSASQSTCSGDPGSPSGPPSRSSAWDHDEWDIAMADGTIYRLSVQRDAGQWYLDGIVD